MVHGRKIDQRCRRADIAERYNKCLLLRLPDRPGECGDRKLSVRLAKRHQADSRGNQVCGKTMKVTMERRFKGYCMGCTGNADRNRVYRTVFNPGQSIGRPRRQRRLDECISLRAGF